MKVHVIGELWEPGFVCSNSYSASPALRELVRGGYERGEVAEAVRRLAGDFARVLDFRVLDHGEVVLPWAEADSEETWQAATD